jgi:hypothetical protein
MGLEEVCLELQTVIAVVHPNARGRDPFTGGNHCRVADGRDQVAMPARFNAQDAEPAFLAVEGYTFD